MDTAQPTKLIPGLPRHSVLYVSATVHPDHPLHGPFRRYVDPAPDFDLGRVVESAGPGIRPYFVERVIDGTTEELPRDLGKYKGLVVGCSLHFVNPDRTPVAPWQDRVMDLIKRAVHDYDMPFLGLCGGGQLGLVALGGRVGENLAGPGVDPTKPGSLVVRTTDVHLTEEGRRDPLFKGCPSTVGMIAIHSDYLAEAPASKFTVLGHADDLPNQVVAYGARARLLGLHPEMSARFVRRVAEVLIETSEFGPYPKEMLYRAVAQGVRETDASGVRVLQNFLSEMCAHYEPRGSA
jgi:GMP synthase-like glutamine amidotransferase